MRRQGRAGHGPQRVGRGMWRRVVVAGVLAVLTVALAGRAQAAAVPQAAVPHVAAVSSVPEGRVALAAGKQDDEHVKKEQIRKTLEKLGVGKDGLLDDFHVTNDMGIPVSAFTIDADDGQWSDWDLKVESWLTNLLFMGVKWLIAFACWLLTWALGFKLAELLLKPALAVSDSLYSNVLVQMGLPSLFLVFSGVTAAWHLWFGRRSRGWGELVASLLIGALAATALASPPQQILGNGDGAVGKARELGIAVASVVMGQKDPTESDPLFGIITPITDKMVDAFVVQPSMVLSYGRTFADDDSKKCASRFVSFRVGQAIYNQKLAEASKQVKDMPSGGDIILPGVGGKIDGFLRDMGLQWSADTFGSHPQ